MKMAWCSVQYRICNYPGNFLSDFIIFYTSMKSFRICWLNRCFLIFAAWLGFSTARAEKVWTNVVSGFWQDGTNWTGHTPPDITAFIQITNDNTKTVTINAQTPFTQTTVQMLTMSAPPGVTNTLLLSNAGTNYPLTFQTGLDLQSGAALRIINSGLLLQLTNDHVNIDGSMTLDGGFIDFGDITVTARVGRATSGLLSINSGNVYAGTITVGGLTNSTGTLSMTGGSLLVSSLMSIGRNPSTVGTMSLSGGRFTVPNDDTRVGDEGIGIMTISNATATLTNLQVGHDPLSAGTLTLQSGGVIQVKSDSSIARFNGSTGIVNVAGGQIFASLYAIYVGRGGDGQLNLSNGTVNAARVLVAADTTNSIGGTGLLDATGGSLIISSNFLVGSTSYATGQVVIAGGMIAASNAQSTAVSSVASGGITLSGGTLVTDNLLVTNAAGQLTFNSGTLIVKNTTVANGSPFVLGDGTSPATLHLNGGTHSFANGLVISSNATLEGCGTILGSIINHGTISTNCGGLPVAPSITTPAVGATAVMGGTVTFSVVVSGTQPLFFQWQHDNTNLAGASSSSLTLTNVQLSDAGLYAVIVTNAAGSITSAPVSLQVTAGVTLAFSGRTDTTNTFAVQSAIGTTYTLEFKDSLTETNWTPLPSITGTGSLLLLQDPSATVPARFYRLRAR